MESKECYADGGSVKGDHEELMNHVALECMHAIGAKDKAAFLDSFHVLVADAINKMMPEEGKEMPNDA